MARCICMGILYVDLSLESGHQEEYWNISISKTEEENLVELVNKVTPSSPFVQCRIQGPVQSSPRTSGYCQPSRESV